MVNLAAAEGHPTAVMDMSFANQALSMAYLWRHGGDLENAVHPVPTEIDNQVAQMKLAATDCHGWHECSFCITPWMACIRAMQGRKMLLHFLRSLHPCNSAIAEEQKSALPPTPVDRATAPASVRILSE
ncbi:adenosylhomocysteinase [Methylotuvimicrobium sp. KM2]|uniref:adenosylhomocysteinase n=1 Tax=Methylotuvimicrobium sp. KM2 TaxID=3133976 RepID=UPI0031012832